MHRGRGDQHAHSDTDHGQNRRRSQYLANVAESGGEPALDQDDAQRGRPQALGQLCAVEVQSESGLPNQHAHSEEQQ